MQQELRWQVRNVSNLGERYDRLEQAYEQFAAKSKAENQCILALIIKLISMCYLSNMISTNIILHSFY